MKILCLPIRSETNLTDTGDILETYSTCIDDVMTISSSDYWKKALNPCEESSSSNSSNSYLLRSCKNWRLFGRGRWRDIIMEKCFTEKRKNNSTSARATFIRFEKAQMQRWSDFWDNFKCPADIIILRSSDFHF